MIRILTLIALIMAPAAMQADTSTSLTSLTQRDDFFGLEAVGRLDSPNSSCSATLISSDLVLTAAHCVFKRGGKVPYAPNELTFRAALTDGEALAERRGYRLAVDPAYESVPGPMTRARIVADIALILLDDPIPASIAAPFALHSGGQISGPVSIVSYGRGRNERMSWQRACNILSRHQGLVLMDCDVTYGSSGSAIFAHENGRYRVLSLTSAIGVINGKKLAYGMELSGRVDALKKTLRNAPVRRSTAEKRIKVGNSSRQNSQARFVRVGD